ncbi:hypothetical protein E4U15_001721 [Claviceps sp. LM218 group G6]|nr:hypothetical protein E4U15_001721 [Claviceps sp. LM218 group G6]KAG6110531.1 hypothetical protein E4U14_002764 [Claviceps sp. LM454 group G7]
MAHSHRNSSDAFPSSPPTGPTRVLDDSDDDDSDEYDFRSEVGGPETYEMIASGADASGAAVQKNRPRERRRRSSSVASFELYTPEEEAIVRRTFDRKLVLFVALLFLLSFLDRSNIGNAKIAGMDTDLQTTPPRSDWYEWALTAFYVSYISFEWMSLLFKIFPAHVIISLAVLTWGIAASLQAIAPSYPVLIALRVLLGIGEAGFAGIPFYLSFFFRREELAFRTAIFVSAAPLGTSFAATLAYGIVWLAGKLECPIAAWRLLFLVEGLPSVLAAVVAWDVIPDGPGEARYLSERQREVACLRLRQRDHHGRRNRRPCSSSSSSSSTNIFFTSSSSSSVGSKTPRIRLHELLALLLDPIAWLTSTMFFLTNMAYSSLPVFLPKIMTQMGHDPLTAQALSAPPYLCAFITVLFTAHMSDRLRVRTTPIVFHALASSAGYTLLALAQPLHLPSFLRYLAVYPAASGFFNVATLLIVWNINNQSSQTRQGGGFAMMQILGQFGPLVGTRLYPDVQAPYYGPGMATCAVAMAVVGVLALVLRMYLRERNRRMDREQEGEGRGEGEGEGEEEEEGLVGGESGRGKRRRGVSFRYML